MSNRRDARRDGRADGLHIEDGRIYRRDPRRPNRAGAAPGRGLFRGTEGPERGYGQSPVRSGPTRGSNRNGHDRKGRWLLG